jgi:hypothetical protein
VLDELIVDEDGQRYVGHVWAATQGRFGRATPLRWCFACHGQVIAEFPATPFDTPAVVRDRLIAVLRRIESHQTHSSDRWPM